MGTQESPKSKQSLRSVFWLCRQWVLLKGKAQLKAGWTFYCDQEESLGTQESTRAAYDRIMELRIATPQIILNYAAFLQVS